MAHTLWNITELLKLYFQRSPKEDKTEPKCLEAKLYTKHDQCCKIYSEQNLYRKIPGRTLQCEAEISLANEEVGQSPVLFYFLLTFPRLFQNFNKKHIK